MFYLKLNKVNVWYKFIKWVDKFQHNLSSESYQNVLQAELPVSLFIDTKIEDELILFSSCFNNCYENMSWYVLFRKITILDSLK